MSNNKHTPGPWTVYDKRYLFTDNEGSASIRFGDIWIADVHGAHVGPQTKEEADANISLIAAAPELLQALKALSSVVGLTAFKYEGQRAVLQEAYDIARDAIAKAEGGSHE